MAVLSSKGNDDKPIYESHLWPGDSFLYAAADVDFAGPAVTLRCLAIQQ